MDNTMPILLVPGLAGSPRIYAPVAAAMCRLGPVTVANHVRDDNMGAIARRILAEAPPRFALAGHSMGGYIAFEIMRQAPDRVAKLALINTQARPRYAGGHRPPPRPDCTGAGGRISRGAGGSLSWLRAFLTARGRRLAPAGP
jgi:pimeloyl-ACP methyl ester carboxylesterase